MNADFLQTLRRDGVVETPDPRLVPLAGGVSSDIYRVEDGQRVFVVKRALEKLRVKADWRADTSRNHYERLYLETVSRIVPGVVPRVLSSHDGYFTMEWLGDDWVNWKTRLLAGDCRVNDAAKAGTILGSIHRATSGDSQLREQFATTKNFRQLRIDPYLLAIAARHPAHRLHIEAEAERIANTRDCLVHGDYSPKNMLLCGDRLVILDCEVAWYGDPAFDVAFLLNHLLLKALHHAPKHMGLDALFDAACSSYYSARSLEASAPFDERTAGVLLLLLLARVDGKSPVEYLPSEKQEHVRRFVLPRLGAGGLSLKSVAAEWFRALANCP